MNDIRMQPTSVVTPSSLSGFFSRRSFLTPLLSIILFGAAFVDNARGQIVEFTWTGGASGDWGNAANWSPEGIPGEAGPPDTRQDRAVIGGGSAVTSTTNILFQGIAEGKSGSHDVLTLEGGASLDVTGTFRTWSWSGANGAARNVLVNAGSELTVAGELQVGAPASTGRTSTWTIHGEVVGESFGGYKTTNDTSEVSIGGFIVDIDGGSLLVENDFNWNRNNTGNPNSIGEVYLSNSGILTAGTMLENWTSSAGNYVNFLDGTGSLIFGYTNWETAGAVQGLIDTGFIRTKLPGGIFDISDNGSGWTVTVIPEPSTYAFLLALFAVAGATVIRRRL